MYSSLWFRPYHHYRQRGLDGGTAVFKFAANWKRLGSFKNYCCVGLAPGAGTRQNF